MTLAVNWAVKPQHNNIVPRYTLHVVQTVTTRSAIIKDMDTALQIAPHVL